MHLNTLKPAVGSIRKGKRIGRGQGSGKGGTATKGHNGAQSRSGYKRKVGFEGGQLPLQQRLPMGGFKCPTSKFFKPINLDIIQELADKFKATIIDRNFLRKHGLLNKHELYKILGKGGLKLKLAITAHAFSKSAVTKIKKLSGSTTILAKNV